MFSAKVAPIISTLVAFILAVSKLVVGFISGSVALFSSALDSLMDMAVSVMNFFAVRYASLPADEGHQFGHGKIEGIAASIEGTAVFMSGCFVVYESIKKIFVGENLEYLNYSIYVMILSIVLTFFLVWYLNIVYKKTNSLVIKGDRLHYKTDLLTNLGVLVSLLLISIWKVYWLDAIVGLLLGIYIIKEAFELIKEGVDVLLDKTLEEFDKIKKILDSYVKKGIIRDYHCLRARKMGNNTKYVEFHMVLDPNLSVAKSHEIGDEIQKNIEKIDKKSVWIVTYHQDPRDDRKENLC